MIDGSWSIPGVLRLDHQPLFGRRARVHQTGHEREAEIEHMELLSIPIPFPGFRHHITSKGIDKCTYLYHSQMLNSATGRQRQ